MAEISLVGVCGPIAAGKSTIVEPLAKALELRAFPERVAHNPFFARFTRDRGAWAFRSQLAFIIGAVEDAAAARREFAGGVLERPAQEMLGVFVRDLREQGLLAADEEQTLTRVLDLGNAFAGKPGTLVPDVLVALRGDPLILFERIRDRARPGEERYTLEDLHRLEGVYANWLGEWEASPVIEVDATRRDLRHTEEIEQIAAEVREVLARRS